LTYREPAAEAQNMLQVAILYYLVSLLSLEKEFYVFSDFRHFEKVQALEMRWFEKFEISVTTGAVAMKI
jgi:hypothetical protein